MARLGPQYTTARAALPPSPAELSDADERINNVRLDVIALRSTQ